MKTLKFEINQPGASKWQKVYLWIILAAVFTYLTVSSAVAFFAPDLSWVKPAEAVYLPTAIMYGCFASMFLWQNSKALARAIATSTLALLFALLPVPSAHAATTCEPGGDLRYAQNFVFFGFKAQGIIVGAPSATVALGLLSADTAYSFGQDSGDLDNWGTRFCDEILESNIHRSELEQMEQEAMEAMWDALAEALDDLVAETTDSISESFTMPVKRYNYDPLNEDLGYDGYSYDSTFPWGGMFFGFGGGYVLINGDNHACFGTSTGVACYY